MTPSAIQPRRAPRFTQLPRPDAARKVLLLNPLGAALEHYTVALERQLADCGAAVRTVALLEPSAPGQTRIGWIASYLRALWHAARAGSGAVVVQTWPVLGYWDFLIARCIARRPRFFLVIHDPVPLVRALGYGRVARAVASLRPMGACAIVHSAAAADAVVADANPAALVELPHPMLPPRARESSPPRAPVVRVLGQYKPDRDTDVMRALAADGPAGVRYEVVGRGWPQIAGWTVEAGFVPEAGFDALIRDSSAIVIPYSRFFQSGVAVRALELGTPVVGLRASSLAELLGVESDWLVDGGEWTRATQAAIDADAQMVEQVAIAAYIRARGTWSAWLDAVLGIAQDSVQSAPSAGWRPLFVEADGGL